MICFFIEGKNSKEHLDEFGVSAIMGMPLQDAFKFPHPLLEGVPKLKTENEQPKSVPAVGGGATVAATKSPATVFSKPQTLEKSPPTETPEEIITPPELEMDVEVSLVLLAVVAYNENRKAKNHIIAKLNIQ